MTDLASAPTMPATDSTTLDPGASAPSAAGGGTPTKVPDLRDAIADAVKEATPKEETDPKADPKEAEAAKTDDKPAKAAEKGAGKAPENADKAEKGAEAKDDPKAPERGPDGKFAGKENAQDAQKPDAKAEDKPNGQHIDPPSKFLPDAKETWRNTPRAVQRDVANMAREHEAEVTRYREAAERYEKIRQFDEIVRQHGREGVHETLAEVAQLEELMSKNPLAALNQILLRAGPRKPDGTPVSLFEVAQTIVQMGQQGYNQAVSSPRQQPQNDNSEIEALKAKIEQMEAQQIAASVLEPFKASHPRYEELKADIAFFLKSGKIPDSLSPQERLEAAYDMAARINPASHVEPVEPNADPDPSSRTVEDFSGGKSIKSAPGAVSQIEEPQRGGSIRDELERAMRLQRRA
jgi:hypothetical protein